MRDCICTILHERCIFCLIWFKTEAKSRFFPLFSPKRHNNPCTPRRIADAKGKRENASRGKIICRAQASFPRRRSRPQRSGRRSLYSTVVRGLHSYTSKVVLLPCSALYKSLSLLFKTLSRPRVAPLLGSLIFTRQSFLFS